MNTYIVVGVILVGIVALLATNKKLVETLKNIYKIEELRSRILFTLGLLLIYRLGSFVTLPGVDHAILQQWTQNFANDSSSLMGLLNIFSGGAFSQASIFALGVMPYITASIIIQLLGIMVPYFRKMQREGESGRRRMNQWTRFLTIAVLLLQAPAYLATQVLSSGAVTVTGDFLGIGALAVAMILISWLANYSEQYLNVMFDAWGWVVYGQYETMLWIYSSVVLLCAVIVWITLHRIRKANRRLAAGMRRNARHALRNTMLGIQLVVCMVFITGSLMFSQLMGYIKDQLNIPDNDDRYAECIQIRPYDLEDCKLFEEYLQTNPQYVKRAIKNNEIFTTFQEYMETPGAKEALNRKNFLVHYLADTTYFDFWQRPIKWFVPKEQRQECILLSEKLYAELDSLGVIKSGTLTPETSATLPIGGTYATLPYKNEIKDHVKWECAVMQECPENFWVEYIIEPEEGKYHEVMEQMKDAMHRINPLPLEPTVNNLREKYTQELSALENFQRGAWILSAICALICFMGIWSTIALIFMP